MSWLEGIALYAINNLKGIMPSYATADQADNAICSYLDQEDYIICNDLSQGQYAICNELYKVKVKYRWSRH